MFIINRKVNSSLSLFRRFYNVSSSNNTKIGKVLIANRGEIAVRIIKTAKKLGIKSVAVYSEADANSMHVNLADEAYCIGPASSTQSYLDQNKIINVACKSKADAIHPGYGFLSENFEFAKLCKQNDLIFIGPPENAIKDMGIKSTSKKIMSEANVPIIPGYHGENQDEKFLFDEAKKLGFPIMIKAVRGGGGKGMRVCLTEEEFFDKLNSAKTEALKSFNDDKMLIEKYIERPRHIEVQVFGDEHGNYVYLFERDCSVQRRHQKIIEEAPAPGLSDELRKKLGTAAVNAAKAVNYVGAGTVEFVFDSITNEFYFMEMNTRLQVEHPITEMITKTDLVEMQFNVANGEKLNISQNDIKINGHSFEARIYAEDPLNDFLPISGKINHLSEPIVSDDVRVETGVRSGDEVSVYYDPMIAKLVVWSNNREKALKKLIEQLSNYKITGLTTNIPFLMQLASHKKFGEGNVYTNFIPDHHDELFKEIKINDYSVIKLTLAFILSEKLKSFQKSNPFKQNDSFRLLNLNQNKKSLTFEDPNTNKKINVEVNEKKPNLYEIKIEDSVYQNVNVFYNNQTNEYNIDLNGYKSNYSFIKDGNNLNLFENNKIPMCLEMKLPHYISNITETSQTDAEIVSPMPGVVEKILVKEGQSVKKGETLAVIIAMKMEYLIKSNKDQVVDKILLKSGENVAKGGKLITFLN